MTSTTKLFAISEQNGVSVITPHGDALSHRDVDVQREATMVNELLQRENVQRLVVDLSEGNYFGSLLIGILNSFGQTVKKQGGMMVLAGASTDMQAIMKVMKLDTLWPHFPNRNDAVKIAKAWKG
ncbi:STAS domain-containing protein [Rubinisphaera margarita]|uniref:STAS domain-containing protein n=1 Tax=Rubinisphaera margarita TaxID=2909586 RepID=UPI001EE9A66D|nr:STAS domain-containing protein [Rubinisphaera margarita]MCG6155197.1 STAS domain-containing protein [Rubinisphaera margarita]